MLKDIALEKIKNKKYLAHLDYEKYLVKISLKAKNYYVLFCKSKRKFEFFNREKYALESMVA